MTGFFCKHASPTMIIRNLRLGGQSNHAVDQL